MYIGVTSDLEKRLQEHKSKFFKGFTVKYNVDILVYYEYTNSIEQAIEREKQLKKWNTHATFKHGLVEIILLYQNPKNNSK